MSLEGSVVSSVLVDSDSTRQLAAVVVWLSAIIIFAYSLFNPQEEWDLLGYAASVLSLGGAEQSTLPAQVYGELKAYAPPELYRELTAGSTYRTAMHNDAEAFSQQVPFYKIRLIFIGLIWLMTKVGIGMFEAMHLLSAVCGSAGFLLIYLSLRRYVHSLFWIVCPWLFYEFSQNLEVIRSGGVDPLAFLWVAVTYLGFIHRSNWLLPVLALSVLVRTDLLIHVVIMCGAVYWSDRNIATLKSVILCVLAAVVLYLGVNSWAGNYGWYTVFYFVFGTGTTATHPEIYSRVNFDIQLVLNAIMSPGWISGWFWVAIISALLCWVACWSCLSNCVKHSVDDAAAQLINRLVFISGIAVAYVVLHYVLFPVIHMRFFVAQCYFMVLALFGLCSYVLSRETR